MSIRESQNTEFKQSWRDEYLKAIVAFANCEGGTLLIGVDDRGTPVGLDKTDRLLEDLPNKIRNKLGIIPSVEIEKIDNAEIVKIVVEPSSVPISYDGKFYLRSGSTVQELKGKELADFLMKKSGSTWDEVVEERAAIEDLNTETIAQFKRYAVDRIPSIAQETDIETLLHKLKLVDGEGLKRAAVLLFGKTPQRFYLQSIVKIGKFLSETDIQSTDVVNSNLFEQLENTLEILRSKYLLSNIKFEGIHRRDILEYPYEALREAIINALIHRDYSGTSHIQIRVYADKLVIMNQGKLPPEIPVETLKTNHLSVPRNPLLAQVFYHAGFIESWGRGTLKIVENCVAQGLPEPDFVAENGVMSVFFYKDKWTEENLEKLGLNGRQVKAVMYVKKKGKITNTEYQESFDVSKRTATNDLEELAQKGLFEKIGTHGRGIFYQIEKGNKRAIRAIKGQ
jgi:ATP-dependent DNA helicase RecG